MDSCLVEQVADGVASLIREARSLESKVRELELSIVLIQRENEKLKKLILLTDPAVSNLAMNEISMIQWQAFSEWKSQSA